MLEIFVPGVPLPAGSGDRTKTRIAGRTCWVGPYIDMSDRKTKKRKAGGLKRWKRAIAEYARIERAELLEGPVSVHCVFEFPRIASHVTKTGALRRGKPALPISKADLDKLCRAVLDALTGIAFPNDAQVCRLDARKIFTPDTPGVSIRVCAYAGDVQ